VASQITDRERAERLRQLRHRVHCGDFAAMDEHNALAAPPAECPLVPVVMGRDGVHLLPRGLVPPELLPENFDHATGTYRIDHEESA
jgi:hypothetical protein